MCERAPRLSPGAGPRRSLTGPLRKDAWAGFAAQRSKCRKWNLLSGCRLGQAGGIKKIGAKFRAAGEVFARTCAAAVAPEATFQAWFAHYLISQFGIDRVAREPIFVGVGDIVGTRIQPNARDDPRSLVRPSNAKTGPSSLSPS